MNWAVNLKSPMRNCDQSLTSLKFQHNHFRSAAILCNPLFSENFADCSNP